MCCPHRRLRICCSLHASSKAAAHACCGGAPAPLPRSATDRARHRSRRSLFCCRTAEPSHTAATMWPKHAPATSAPTTNWLCCPPGFHVHASTAAPMCLHHAHLLPPERPAPPQRRVRRTLIAIQPKEERAALGEKCFCRQKTQISRRLLRPSRPGELPGSPSESPAAIPPYTKSIAQFSSPITQYQKHTSLCKIESSYQILRTGQRATDKTRKVST